MYITSPPSSVGPANKHPPPRQGKATASSGSSSIIHLPTHRLHPIPQSHTIHSPSALYTPSYLYTSTTPPHPDLIILPIIPHHPILLAHLSTLCPSLPPLLLNLQNVVLAIALPGFQVEVSAKGCDGEAEEEELAVTATAVSFPRDWNWMGGANE